MESISVACLYHINPIFHEALKCFMLASVLKCTCACSTCAGYTWQNKSRFRIVKLFYLLYKYSEQPSKPSSSSSHFSAGVSWSDSVDANKHAPDSTRNFTIAKLLQLAAQCNGVQPSESWAFTSHPNSTKNLSNPKNIRVMKSTNNYYSFIIIKC